MADQVCERSCGRYRAKSHVMSVSCGHPVMIGLLHSTIHIYEELSLSMISRPLHLLRATNGGTCRGTPKLQSRPWTPTGSWPEERTSLCTAGQERPRLAFIQSSEQGRGSKTHAAIFARRYHQGRGAPRPGQRGDPQGDNSHRASSCVVIAFTCLHAPPAATQIRAGTTAVGQEEELFLNKTEPIWTPASPRESKVVGAHTHAFSISIPQDATIAPVPKATPRRFALPPTFSERASPAYIDYKLYVTVRRGGLWVNNKCVYSSSIHILPASCQVVMRTGCQQASPSSHARWQTHRPPCALLRMLRPGWSLVQMRTPKAGKCLILSRSQARSSMRGK